MQLFLLALICDQGTVMFQLSGFYCGSARAHCGFAMQAALWKPQKMPVRTTEAALGRGICISTALRGAT